MTTTASNHLPGLSQPAILGPVPALGRSLIFRLLPTTNPGPALRTLRDEFKPVVGVVGIGEPLVRSLGANLPGLRAFPALSAPAGEIPSTQQALWIFLGGDNRSGLFDATVRIESMLAGAFALEDAIDTFTYAGGRDLTGYEDGTENPRGEAAIDSALVTGPDGLSGSSFVAVQRWIHDLHRFYALSPDQRDAIIGRLAKTNAEIADAPASAHVKRSAQESFVPPSFMLRRSMPWSNGLTHGLEFIAYGASLDRYERVLRRMVGFEDSIVDALFTFSRPVSGGYYWCPPIAGGRLDLRALE